MKSDRQIKEQQHDHICERGREAPITYGIYREKILIYCRDCDIISFIVDPDIAAAAEMRN